MERVPKHFVDLCLIYQDEDVPGQWIGHSLNTDHVAVGDCVLDAYMALERVLHALWQEANADPRVRLFSRAPQAVRDRLKHARPLPKELLEIAELKRSGRRVPKQKQDPYGGRVRNLQAGLEVAVAG